MHNNSNRAANRKNRRSKVYLTKRSLASAAQKGIRTAAETAMETMGFVVVADGNHIVKKFKDGSIEIIKSIGKKQGSRKIILDK